MAASRPELKLALEQCHPVCAEEEESAEIEPIEPGNLVAVGEGEPVASWNTRNTRQPPEDADPENQENQEMLLPPGLLDVPAFEYSPEQEPVIQMPLPQLADTPSAPFEEPSSGPNNSTAANDMRLQAMRKMAEMRLQVCLMLGILILIWEHLYVFVKTESRKIPHYNFPAMLHHTRKITYFCFFKIFSFISCL